MIFSRAWFALMRRNVTYRQRNWMGTLFELALPLVFVGALVAIKAAVSINSSKLVPVSYPNDNVTYTPLTFRDYVTAMQAQRYCVAVQNPEEAFGSEYEITGLANAGRNWQVTTAKCDSRKCEADGQNAALFCEYFMLAVTGTNVGGIARAADFKSWIYETYPVLKPISPGVNSPALNFTFEFVRVFESESAMTDYVEGEEYGDEGYPKIAMGIVFDGDDPNWFRYALRPNSTNFNVPEEEGRPGSSTTPPTNQLFNSYARDDFSTCIPLSGTANQGPLSNSCTGQYLYNGVLTFQRLVGDYILDRTVPDDPTYRVAEAGVQYVAFPTPPYEESGFFGDLGQAAPLMVILGFLYPVFAMIAYVTREKELRQKELMKMMSVTESDIGWSWFMTFIIFNVISATIVAGVSTKLFTHSDFGQLWFFWLLSYTSFTAYCMLIASTTSKSVRGILIGLLTFFAGVFLTLAVSYDTGSPGALGILSLHPVAAFSYGLQTIGQLEDQGIGLNGSSGSQTDNPSGYTYDDARDSLIVDCLLWGILTWYLNRVMRPDYGQALPWYFPFQMSYWRPGSVKARPVENDGAIDDPRSAEFENIPLEPVSETLQRQSAGRQNIEIRRLRKAFGDEKIAVDNLTLSMYAGQITALLGHNGAGKTTTINMLTGAIAPTAGTATMAGRDIRTQLPQIRQDIGICLQHDCLFPDLTVREHLQFFSRLKGLYDSMSYAEAEQHIDQAIQDVALAEKRNTRSKNLSGGMKRKLSVAMAFCGGSKIVLLDEPTSGMDPFSRRFTWNVIRQYRQDRIIILTTHFMDEADILGDRIAIMAEGRLRCAGSSLFLKKTYGVGYQLTIEKNHDGPSTHGSSHGRRMDPEDRMLFDIVKHAVPDASLLTNVGTELSFQIPLAAASKFPTMFEGLEEQIEKKVVTSYGVSITTLDEVFLLVARGDHGKAGDKAAYASSRLQLSDKAMGSLNTEDAENSVRSRMDLEKEGLFVRHVGALFRKRAANFKRDRKSWICTTILPSLCVLIGFMLFAYVGPSRNLQPVALTLDDYNPDVPTNAPQNPIVFNSPGKYRCQPGLCAYQQPVIVHPELNELYFFCGYQGRFANGTERECSITESSEIVNGITQAGAQGIETTVTGVHESSISLYESSTIFAASQYGALFFTHDRASTIIGSGESYRNATFAACTSRLDGGNYSGPNDCDLLGGIGYIIQYNFTALHVSPLFQSLADEAVVREATRNPAFTIDSTIHPLPITNVEVGFGDADDAFEAWILVVLSFPFVTGSFAAFIVAERESKAKHLQTVAGVKPSAYWLSTYLWDILNYQIPLWITIALMFAFDVQVLTTTTDNILSGVIAALFLFGPASAGFNYCASFAFTSPSACFMVTEIVGFLIGLGGPLANFILLLIGKDTSNPKPNLVHAANALTWILRFLPTFNLGKALFNAINIESFKYLEGDPDLTAWTEPILLYEVIFLAWQSVAYVWLAMLIDRWSTNPRMVNLWRTLTCRSFGCCSRTSSEVDITTAQADDDDVLEEEKRIAEGDANSDLIVVNQLTKVYDTGKIAVNNLSLGIAPGECFGLLGINGAGKTTTMAMLTAEFPPTSGDATLAGYSVVNEPEKTRRRIGYCPQFDAHFANMTGREHVELYASIKGVPLRFVKDAAASKLKEVGLSDSDADRVTSGYSGGMRRRLSLACATIGQPQIVFLDECSTGVDPVARREIWQLKSDMVSSGSNPEERASVILTTHSMEECEALCPRIGIMANGRLRCLGSAQHLKNKFGQGYQVELKVKSVDRKDDDYLQNTAALFAKKEAVLGDSNGDVEASIEAAAQGINEAFFNLDEAMEALRELTGDDFLSSKLSAHDPVGYSVWKDASSTVGVSLDHLAAFATSELRMRALDEYIQTNYKDTVLRERQDSKARYEVSSQGVRISQIFGSIEENKDRLRLSDYGVSQTSLEQVFNMHAAEAEKLKEGRNDG